MCGNEMVSWHGMVGKEELVIIDMGMANAGMGGIRGARGWTRTYVWKGLG